MCKEFVHYYYITSVPLRYNIKISKKSNGGCKEFQMLPLTFLQICGYNAPSV